MVKWEGYATCAEYAADSTVQANDSAAGSYRVGDRVGDGNGGGVVSAGLYEGAAGHAADTTEQRAFRLGHRAYHFATFGTTALATLLLTYGFRAEVKGGLAIFGLGCAIEVTQYAVGFSKVLEWWDVRDDSYAVTAVFLLVQVANARSREGPS